jgi:hypothetical protein
MKDLSDDEVFAFIQQTSLMCDALLDVAIKDIGQGKKIPA